MNIAPSVIQAVKERLNLADVVRRYVPDLKMIAGRWMCICPFHAETKPSMNIHEDTGFFHCFGCQAKGDVIEFVRRIEGLDFQETIRKLAAEAGVQLGQEDPQAVELAQRKKNALAMHVEASAMFREVLAGPMGETARAYLSKRGISEATAGRFQVGVSPEDWHALHDRLAAKGWKKEAALEAGLLTRNTKGDRVFDRFRGRLMFPIHNLAGHVVAFGGRVLGDGEPKYLNTSDSPIFRKGEHLYGLAQARTSIVREKRALLTEGYVDVLSLHQFGFNNSVGVLGTALTSEQVKRLLGFCSEILLIFDGDGPGRKAAFRSSELLILAGARGKVVLLPDGEDVDSLLQRQGREALDACLSMAQDSLDFCLTVAKEEMAPREMLAWARTFMRRFDDPALRSIYFPLLAEGIGVSLDDLRRGESFPLSSASAFASDGIRRNLVPGTFSGHELRTEPRNPGSDPAPSDQKSKHSVPPSPLQEPSTEVTNMTGESVPTKGREDIQRKEDPSSPARCIVDKSKIAPKGLRVSEDGERLILSLAIRHPSYVSALEALGLARKLRTPWAAALWAVLRVYHGGPMPSGLTDPKARAFWNEAVQEKRLVGMEFVEVWADVERALDFEGLTNKEGL